MRKIRTNLLAALAVISVSATVAEATPAFARQMGTDCTACHFQNIPKLNKFGRDFKLSGFTMTGTPTIEGEANGGTSLASVLNFGFVTKARLHKSEDTNLKTEVFDEAAILLGGRVSENIGTSMEFGAGLLGGKFIYSQDALGGKVGLAYYMTDALGAFSGLEGHSTGLYRPIRQFENRKKTNILQTLGIGAGEATGGQMYYTNSALVATAGAYMPTFGASSESGYTGYKLLARAAYEMNLGGQEIALGGYYLGGDVSDVDYAATEKIDGIDTNALTRTSYGVDLQTQGNLGDMTLMLTGALVLKDTYTDDNGDQSQSGYNVEAQLNPSQLFGLKAAYMAHIDNNADTAGSTNYTAGIDYNLNTNVRLVLEYTLTVLNDTDATKQNDILFMSMIAF